MVKSLIYIILVLLIAVRCDTNSGSSVTNAMNLSIASQTWDDMKHELNMLCRNIQIRGIPYQDEVCDWTINLIRLHEDLDSLIRIENQESIPDTSYLKIYTDIS